MERMVEISEAGKKYLSSLRKIMPATGDEQLSAFAVHANAPKPKSNKNKKKKKKEKERIRNMIWEKRKELRMYRSNGNGAKQINQFNKRSYTESENLKEMKPSKKQKLERVESSNGLLSDIKKSPYELLSPQTTFKSGNNKFNHPENVKSKHSKISISLAPHKSKEDNSATPEPDISAKSLEIQNNEMSGLQTSTTDAKSIKKILKSDSTKEGEEVFGWMISPTEVKTFFKSVWEKKPLLITRNKESFYNKICTLEDLNTAFRDQNIYFKTNLDVTSYVNGVKKLENPVGRARPQAVWDLYNRGKSIRLLNPQSFIPSVNALLTILQEYFQCFVGANMYLTPAGTQGFAPHYDDIEAFVLQLDGEKHWKLYDPISPGQVLPRYSSPDFSPTELGRPTLEVTLRPGDLLYFPRGVIHQAHCVPEAHSLHITVSCYQKTAFADLLEKVVPAALKQAISEDVAYREGLPLNLYQHLGLVHSDQVSGQREAFIDHLKGLVSRLVDFCIFDAGVDQLAQEFLHASLPPCLSQVEKEHSGAAASASSDVMRQFLEAHVQSKRSLGVKLIRANCLRLLSEDGSLQVHYNTDNSLEYYDEEKMSFEVCEEWALGVEQLIVNYPSFTPVNHLTGGLDLLLCLSARGLLLFDKPVRRDIQVSV